MPFNDNSQNLNRQNFNALNKMLDAALDKVLYATPAKDSQQLLSSEHAQLINSVNKSIAVLQKILSCKEVDEDDLTECFPIPVLRYSDRADLPPGNVPIVHRCSSEENEVSASCFQEWLKRKNTNEDYGVQTESDAEDNNIAKKTPSCTIM